MVFRGKRLKKIAVAFVCSLLLTSIIGVSAANMSPELIISTDKDEYASNGEISVEVSLNNGTDNDISDITITSEVPEGLKVANGDVNYNTDIVKVGESVSYRYTLNSVSSETGDEENSGSEENNDTNVKDENQNNQNKDSNTDKKNTDGKSKSIKTGDEDFSNLIIIFLLSFVIILCLSNKKIRKRFFVFVIAGALISTNLLNVAAVNDESNKESISVEKIIKVGDKEYHLKANADYETTDDEYMTRGEWINTLVGKMEYPAIDFSLEKPYFDDTSGTSVEDAINYAVAYKIVDLNSDKFYPAEYATREFIATTTVNALGFATDKEIECADSLNISNKQAAYLAVDLNIIDLIDGYFYPNEYAGSNIIDQAITVIDEVLSSTNVSETPINESKLKDNVKKISADQATVSNGVITINRNILEDVAIGDIVVVDDNNAYKVSKITNQGNQIILNTTIPEINEVYEKLHMEGTTTADFSDFVPAEGVTVNYTGKNTRSSSTLPDGGIIDTIEFNFKLLDDLSVKGVLKPDIAVTYKGEENDNNNFLIVYTKSQIEAGVYSSAFSGSDENEVIDPATLKKVEEEFNKNGSCNGTYVIGTLPIPSTPVVLEFGLQYTLEGYFKLVCNFNGKFGIQQYNGNYRIINQIDSEVSTEFGGSMSTGPEIIGGLKVGNLYILDASASLGAAGQGRMTIQSNGMICSDINCYMYFNIAALKHTEWDDIFSLQMSWDIWDSSNSPLNGEFHLENGKIVDQCTYVPFFAGGDGSEENPYQVSTPEQLYAVRDNLEAHYIQINDIDLSTYKNWEPIGYGISTVSYLPGVSDDYEIQIDEFKGTYNGNNYIIDNMNISKSDKYTVGLFGKCSENSLLKNINLKNVNINLDRSNYDYLSDYNKYKTYCYTNVGTIAGYSAGIIENCNSLGEMVINGYSNGYYGGITGLVKDISNCTNNVKIRITNSKSYEGVEGIGARIECGGITGSTESVYGNVNNCSNYGAIDVEAKVVVLGGIIGEDGKLKNVINYGEINATSHNGFCYMGGISGDSGAIISDAINYGNIYGISKETENIFVGGIAGRNGSFFNGTFNNCFNLAEKIYSIGEKYDGTLIDVSGSCGRMFGYNSTDNTTNCYSLDYTLLNEEIPSDNIGSSLRNGDSLTLEEMNEKTQYILDELGI